MRFVLPKTEEQQARAVLFRARERLVHQRTELMNALRATLYEYGYVVPQGAAPLKRIVETIETETSYLPELAREDAAEKLEDWRRHYNNDRPHSAIGYNVPSVLHFPDGATSPPP